MKQVLNPKYLKLVLLLGISVSVVLFFVGYEGELEAAQISQIQSSNFRTQMRDNGVELASKDYYLIWFTARWCSLCATSSDTIREATGGYQPYLQLIELDVDDYPALTKAVIKQSPPALLLYSRGGEFISELEFKDSTTLLNQLAIYIKR